MTKSTNWLWGTIGLASLLSTIVLLAGLGYAVNHIMNPRPTNIAAEPAEREQATDLASGDGRIDIVALGDSLTKGTGDQTGEGYIGRLKRKLAEATGQEVHVLNNLAVNGYRTDQLLADLTDKPSVADALARADVIVFTIGGNDLFRFALEGMSAGTAQITGEELLRSMPEPSVRLGAILDRLSAINPNAVIVYIGLYNPFRDLDEGKQSSLAIAEWNDSAYRLVHAQPNAILVPVADLFELNLTEYLYSDHFHPNGAGYERIAERVAQALR